MQFSSVHVNKRSDTTAMAAMLSDTHHKDGTHYDTRLWTLEATLANFKIRSWEIFNLQFKTFMYMQVLGKN